MDETRVGEVEPTSRILPSQVEREALNGLSIAQPLDALDHHDHRHDAWWHRAPTHIREEIGERLIRKEAVPFLMEDAVNRRLAQPFLAELAARTVEVFVCR